MLQLYTKEDMRNIFEMARRSGEPFDIILTRVKLISNVIDEETINDQEKGSTDEKDNG